MLELARITLFPIKSLPGVEVESAAVLPSGALEWDRRFGLVDARGLITAKREPQVHRWRLQLVAWGDETLHVAVEAAGGSRLEVELPDDSAYLARWADQQMGTSIEVRDNPRSGFPDDPDAGGPTLVSTASLAAVSDWFGLDFDETRRRFRLNLELSGGEPFWEDRLVGASGELRPLRIGSVELLGVNACQRCAVPTRDSRTGRANSHFPGEFSRRRLDNLPSWATPERFDHGYRLGVNTRVGMEFEGGQIAAGDSVETA